MSPKPFTPGHEWAPRTGDATYAPNVPYAERVDPPGVYQKRARRRFRERWGDRVLMDVDVFYQLDDRKQLVQYAVLDACRAVWDTARPLAGLLDLEEISHRLDRERWTCLQLARQLNQLGREPYTTNAAEQVLVDQLTQRLAELAEWAEQHRRLYAEHGTNPASLPDAVGRALAVAESLADDRPARDTAEMVGELRRLLNTPATKEA